MQNGIFRFRIQRCDTRPPQARLKRRTSFRKRESVEDLSFFAPRVGTFLFFFLLEDLSCARFVRLKLCETRNERNDVRHETYDASPMGMDRRNRSSTVPFLIPFSFVGVLYSGSNGVVCRGGSGSSTASGRLVFSIRLPFEPETTSFSIERSVAFRSDGRTPVKKEGVRTQKKKERVRMASGRPRKEYRSFERDLDESIGISDGSPRFFPPRG